MKPNEAHTVSLDLFCRRCQTTTDHTMTTDDDADCLSCGNTRDLILGDPKVADD